MNIKNEDLKELLLKENYITPEEIQGIDKFLKSDRGSLMDYLLNEGIITKSLLGQAIAESMGTRFVDLGANPPPGEKVLLIPEDVAAKYNVAFYAENDEQVTVGTDKTDDKNLLKELEQIFKNKKIFVGLAFVEDVHALFIYYRKPLETRFTQIIKDKKHIAPEIFNTILDDAMAFHASDIHFEPFEKKIAIRFRIDGILHDAGAIPGEYYENVLNWIKVQSKMRIDEHRVPQDGSMRIVKEEKALDMRVSIAPIIDGENIVIRILTAYVKSFALEDLGFSSTDCETIRTAAHMPFGMFLVTGPTGSGKTTTLYAIIKILNKPDLNITTIEDPIEYKIPGINQIQVNLQTNLTFSQGLRSIVRQDPNVILVGEIRDQETAEISVNAALTGHLLFSTFHANDASTAIPRLIDMGIEPFILSSTLKIVAAQRLVRQICVHCRFSKLIDKAELQKVLPSVDKYFPEKSILLYQGKGCTICGNTGYKDRTAIFEFIKVTPAMQVLILKNPSGKEIWELAEKEGSISLFDDGMEKVKNGITTIEELLRVSEPPQLNEGQKVAENKEKEPKIKSAQAKSAQIKKSKK